MYRSRCSILLPEILVVSVVGCSTEPSTPPKLTTKKVDSSTGTSAEKMQITIHVKGMTKQLGITWLTWPNKVKKALDGLNGVYSVKVELSKDLFHVSLDPKRLTTEKLLATILGTGFNGQIIQTNSTDNSLSAKICNDIDRLPKNIQTTFFQARKQGKRVLLTFHGPGWLACKRMDTVAYPHADVKKELNHWVVYPVNIAVRSKVAEMFNVVGIPVAVALTASGDESGRIEGFVEPMKFKKQLQQFRLNKSESVGQTNGASMLTDLARGEKELKTVFNRDKGYVRLMLILSPS